MRDDHRNAGPHGNAGPGDSLDDARAHELVFAVDDEDAPTEVTVSPRRSADDTTAWLTMDAEHIVDLDANA